MHYIARISREGRQWLADFPDCPGCQTFASSAKELPARAHEALHGWLEAHLLRGTVPDPPKARREGPNAVRVDVEAPLAVSLQLRWARARQRLSQEQVAERAGVSQQQIAKLERPNGNPTLATLRKVASALGATVAVELRDAG
jgi:DNA-binding XRE family transcriptional regulator/predicted RNase H-like HicB family nuclease